MKTLKIISLSAGIWGLGLLWPDLNQSLTPLTTAFAVIGLGILALVYRRLSRWQSTRKPAQPGRSLPSSITRPTRPLQVM